RQSPEIQLIAGIESEPERLGAAELLAALAAAAGIDVFALGADLWKQLGPLDGGLRFRLHDARRRGGQVAIAVLRLGDKLRQVGAAETFPPIRARPNLGRGHDG